MKIGQLHGDLKLRGADDGFIEIKFKSINFPVSSNRNNSFDRLFVHTNGLLSFDRELSYSGEITTNENITTEKRRFIAPLWSDIDTRYNGDVFYREITNFKDLNGLIKIALDFVHFEKGYY